ncbi:MAG: DNA alkylation repair protein [Bacteroides sp.]|nr:DNA alkylation repair protein [Roseburia sp.]MCM1346819.1 DNA alkylation repair protein [Bacteroides sp.]MCM1421367.1 DNA alkylation repair protein [Bacteroides sp.]
MKETTRQHILDIKKELRANMNGVASAAMRQAGVAYRVNFGIEIPRIHAIASEFEPDHELAQELWKEEVRELKIMATILQPLDTFFPELADVWVENIRNVEIAQLASLNLFGRLPYASDLAFRWIASEEEMVQVCGYYTMCHVLRRGKLNERSVYEFQDQANAAAASTSAAVRTAAQRAMNVFEQVRGADN